MRIVSLLPSATELLCAIGGEERLVGRSHECDHPASIQDRPVLTSQKTLATTSGDIDRQVRQTLRSDTGGDDAPDRSLYILDIELLLALKPDVILTQDLCDVCSIDLNTVRRAVRSLDSPPRVVSLNPMTIDDVFDDMLRVGEAVELTREAREAMIALRERYWQLREFVNAYVAGPQVAFLEWLDPLFIGGHWTPQLIEQAGGRHALNEPGAASRQIQPEDLLEAMPDRLILCPCGFSLEQTTRELPTLTAQRWWKLLPAVHNDEVVIVDGSQMFNCPGPRLIDAFAWLVAWIHDRPELIPPGFPIVSLSEAH